MEAPVICPPPFFAQQINVEFFAVAVRLFVIAVGTGVSLGQTGKLPVRRLVIAPSKCLGSTKLSASSRPCP